MNKAIKVLLIVMLGIALGIYFGPRVTYEAPILLDTKIEMPLSSLDSFVAAEESKFVGIKPDNNARIVWANDSLKQKTEYSVVYLHGFSASKEEGAPLHTDFAKRYGFNLYLARLEDHGRADSNSFIGLTPSNYLQSAEDAINIGKLLGNKVIVMSCSTGGTLSIILAAAGEKSIHSLIMYSPNIDIYDTNSDLLLYPWGQQMSDLILGGNINKISYYTLAQKYWNTAYHTNGLFAMKTIIHDYMHEETFKKIKIPVFLGYYYKDEEFQDKVVSVNRMLEFYDQISTPKSQKHKIAFPNVGNHVMSSYIMSKDIDAVRDSTFKWSDKVLGFEPVK